MASREFLKILSSARLGDVSAQQKLASVYLTGAFKTPIQPSNALIWLEKSYFSITNHLVGSQISSSAEVLDLLNQVAFIIALPVVMYQIWAFIAPGLYLHERKLILPLVVSSYTLFIIGMAFAYFLVFPTVFKFMASYNAPLGAEMSTDIDNYLSFAMTTFLAFGITFEVPVVVVVLVRMGMVPLAKLKEIRPYVIVGAFVISAVVTPPDVLSQLLLAVPMTLLYELGLLVARFYVPKSSDEDAATDQSTSASA
jgi:sec-independent protein translocase protein TatC